MHIERSALSLKRLSSFLAYLARQVLLDLIGQVGRRIIIQTGRGGPDNLVILLSVIDCPADPLDFVGLVPIFVHSHYDWELDTVLVGRLFDRLCIMGINDLRKNTQSL